MQPNLKFRLHSTVNEVTSEMVQAERTRTDDLMAVCKKRLENQTGPVLQQWYQASVGESVNALPGEFEGEGGKWVPVEHVVEIFYSPEKNKKPRP